MLIKLLCAAILVSSTCNSVDVDVDRAIINDLMEFWFTNDTEIDSPSTDVNESRVDEAVLRPKRLFGWLKKLFNKNWPRRYATHPYDRPFKVPYSCSAEIKEGQTISIHGRMIEGSGSERFDIALYGERSDRDVILGITNRAKDEQLVYNTMKNGVWDKETRRWGPFITGDYVDIRIRVRKTKFEVWINGYNMMDYAHRLPITDVKNIFVRGDLELDGVHWGGNITETPVQTNLTNWGKGARAFVSGVVKGSFTVRLFGHGSDILFELRVDMDKNTAEMNSRKGERWGQVRYCTSFPFAVFSFIDLVFVNERNDIQVYWGNDHIGTFFRRTLRPDTDYIRLRVDGDLEVTEVLAVGPRNF